jgi:hypothetical protein
VVEQSSQEELHGTTHRVSLESELVKINSEALNLVVVTDEFDENVDTEVHIEEDNKAGINESDEENMQPIVDTAPDTAVDTIDKGNGPNDLTCSRINWSSYYSKEELRALKVKLINLQDYPNNKDISHIESAVIVVTKSCSLLTHSSYMGHHSNTLAPHPLASDAIQAWFLQTR